MSLKHKVWQVGDRVIPSHVILEKKIFYKAYVQYEIPLPKGFTRFPDHIEAVIEANKENKAEKRAVQDYVRQHRITCAYYVSGNYGYLHKYDGLYFAFQLVTWEEGLELNLHLVEQQRQGIAYRMEKEMKLQGLDSKVQDFKKYLDQLKNSGDITSI